MPVEVTPASADPEHTADAVRMHVFAEAAASARVPQPAEIARALARSEEEIRTALRHLARHKVLILAPNDGNIWSANPFCAVPSGFRVHAAGKRYEGICIWDAMGIAAALGEDALISASCGDCGERMTVEIRNGALTPAQDGVVHFAVPAKQWWDNIGFT